MLKTIQDNVNAELTDIIDRVDKIKMDVHADLVRITDNDDMELSEGIDFMDYFEAHTDLKISMELLNKVRRYLEKIQNETNTTTN